MRFARTWIAVVGSVLELAAAGSIASETAAPTAAANAARDYRQLMAEIRYADALAPAERWLAIAEDSGDDADRIAALRAVGESFAARRMTGPAAERFERALALAETLGEPRRVADLQLRLAEQRTLEAEFAAADKLILGARALAQRAGGFDARFEFELETAAGTLAIHRRDPLESVERRRAALAAAERLGEDGARATALTNLGRALSEIHDHAAAIGFQQRALELPDPHPDRRAITLGNLGISHYELGQLEEAEGRFVEARAFARAADSPRIEGWLEGELALVASKSDRDDEAIERFQRAIEIARRTNDPRNEAVWLQNLGGLHRDRGRCVEALPIYARALALREQIGAPEPHLFKHLGQCRAALGDDHAAEALFERALALARETAESRALWETERERARLFRRQGRFEAATDCYLAALDAIETTRSTLALPAFKTDFFEGKVEVYDEVVAFLAVERGRPDEALAVAERARARGFLDTLAESRARVEASLPPALLAAERRLNDQVSSVAAALRRDGATPERTAALAAAERALEAHQLRVRLEHPAFRALRHPTPATLGALQTAIDDGSALVVFWLGGETSHRWTVRRARLDHALLPSRAEIERAARRAYGELSKPGVHPDGGVAALGALLLVGLDPRELPPRLVIVPDGILHYLPFEPLPLAAAGELGRLARIAYLPAASLLTDLPVAPARVRGSPRLLALGAPNAGADRTDALRPATLSELSGLGALPHAAREARAVAGLWGREHATLLVERGATEARLRALPLAEFAVVHLAAHGWLDPHSAARSGLLLESGAPDGATDDGVLALRDILALELDADLVTLSACRSGLGDLVSGEGMVGVTRAFLHAGGRSIVASLWAVDDEATAAFMTRFYRALANQLPIGDALERARSELRAEARWRHPFYWAPWIVVGRGEATVPFPRSAFAGLGALAGALALAAAAAIAWRVRRARRRAAAVSMGVSGCP